MFGGKGMGGGSGGSMLRTVGRAVGTARTTGVAAGAALQESISSSGNTPHTSISPTSRPTHKPSSSSQLSLSSTSPFASHNVAISATSGIPTWPPPLSQSDELDWVSVDGSEDKRPLGYFDDFVLGPVPSMDEVQDAVSALQQVFDPASYCKAVPSVDNGVADQVTSPTGLELDWVEPSLHLCNSRILQTQGSNRVYNALHLLQTEPSVQRMVISLSSDKLVWDAVLNNEVVRELRESYSAVENKELQSPNESSEDSNEVANILRWIFDNTKAKVMEVIENITKLMNELFQSPDNQKTTGATDPFKEKLKASFMLSVVVLLIVVVSRAHKA
ncbi:uncharacterized protein LOC122318393 [Carya illinoinensis]|nr:uncharacterized protein LOC122318393 [Carya illinoinensis]